MLLTNPFSQHRVVAISGEEARKMFFNEKGLGLDEGYRILMGGAPNIDDISVQPKEGRVKDAELVKRMAVLFRKDRVVDGTDPTDRRIMRLNFLHPVLPVLLDDVHRRMNDWGNEGTINPFKELYDVSSIFILTYVEKFTPSHVACLSNDRPDGGLSRIGRRQGRHRASYTALLEH